MVVMVQIQKGEPFLETQCIACGHKLKLSQMNSLLCTGLQTHVTSITLTYILYRIDYVSVLWQLSGSADNADSFAKKAQFLLDGPLGGDATAVGTTASVSDLSNVNSCFVSTSLLQRFNSSMLRDFTPLAVVGDGNCLFRAVSLGLYGMEDRHMELRAKAAIEIGIHQDWYNKASRQFCAPFKDDPFVLLPDYAELCKQVSTSGEHVGILCALALSAVCCCKIQLYFPPLNPVEASCRAGQRVSL